MLFQIIGILNPKEDTNAAIVNTLFLRINREYELRASLTGYYRW